MNGLIQLDALGPRGRFRADNRFEIRDVADLPIAEMSLAPSVFVYNSLAALRQAPAMPDAKRAAALVRAGQIFAAETIDGLSVREYEHVVSRVSGVPISAVRAATRYIADVARGVCQAVQEVCPVDDDRAPRSRRLLWARRADVLAINAAGNHPAAQSRWLEAVALGYRVAVRPSTREPFTAHRLVGALRAAGFRDDHVVLLPTEPVFSDDLIGGADLALVYGGELIGKYATDRSVLLQGAGRSKVLLTGDDWRHQLDAIVGSISHAGGTTCTNTTAIFVQRDPAQVADAVAQRLAALPSRPPEAEDAVLPVQSVTTSRRLDTYLRSHGAGTTAWLGGGGIVDELSDGSAVLRPAVFEVERSDAPQLGIELPFPCVWIAPWSTKDGVTPLRNTLALTVIGAEGRSLIEQMLTEPTIDTVYAGGCVDHWSTPDRLPDGRIVEFLMRTKSYVNSVLP
ncbi:aldehyde dehydrogenase family protein [Nocardia sp. NPDC006044]|uniref:aldehyde dehydrogenase family protein n=1 Tax=Nocardia sp. NPDC006044 TaxID=3364306 RepID=UPI0036AB03FA